MGTIIKTYGYVEPLTIVVLNDLQADGTILKIKRELRRDTQYQVMYWDDREKAIITTKGKFITALNDDYHDIHHPDNLDYIVLDRSTTTKSDRVRIRIRDIKSIEQIVTL